MGSIDFIQLLGTCKETLTDTEINVLSK